MENLVWWGLTTLLGAFIGSYLAGYLKKKGENLATHEDLNRLVKQMEATTNATKAIETRFSNEAWDRQKHWEMKKEAVFAVMQALGRADDALLCVSTAIEEELKTDDPETFEQTKLETFNAWYKAMEDFEMKRAMAALVCEKKTNEATVAVRRELRDAETKIREEGRAYRDLTAKLRPAIAKCFACAQRELGVSTTAREDD